MSEENRPPDARPSARPPEPPAGLRASDADRERLIDELNEHAGEGRLDTDELEDRLNRAYAARTTAELDALRRDLPATRGQAAVSHRERRSQLSRRMIQESGGSIVLFLVCTAIWAASGASGGFWPVWVLVLVVMSLARTGWALWGPAADLDEVEQQLDARNRRRAEHRSRHLDRDARRGQRRDR